jgi:hypothetical protein
MVEKAKTKEAYGAWAIPAERIQAGPVIAIPDKVQEGIIERIPVGSTPFALAGGSNLNDIQKDNRKQRWLIRPDEEEK